MKIGDKVIVNPDIAVDTWNNSHTFTMKKDMQQPGVFKVISVQNDIVGIQAIPDITYANDVTNLDIYNYQEDWLIPVPIFKVGDLVQIKNHLDEIKPFPYGLTSEMEDLEETISSVAVVIDDCTVRRIYNLGDDGCKYFIAPKGGTHYHFTWSSLALTSIKNTNHYENQLQRQKSTVTGGSRESKCGIRSRKHMPRVTIKSLSYETILGRG